jgi:hypothetical protein
MGSRLPTVETVGYYQTSPWDEDKRNARGLCSMRGRIEPQPRAENVTAQQSFALPGGQEKSSSQTGAARAMRTTSR